MTITLPGDLTSPIAGPILRRGAPVLFRLAPDDLLTGGVVVAFGEQNQIAGVAWEEDGACFTDDAIDLDSVFLDLSDPAGMDIAARWLAAHHGIAVGATAPEWRMVMDFLGGYWLLTSRLNGGLSFGPTEWTGGRLSPIEIIVRARRVPIPALTDPALALRAACLAAVGRTG